jgi:hypothetical protein
MGWLDEQEIQKESSTAGDILKGAVTGVADLPVVATNSMLDAVDNLLYDSAYKDIRIQKPSKDPVIKSTVTGGTAYEVSGDITRAVTGGALLRSQLGLTKAVQGSGAVVRGLTVGGTDAIAENLLNDMNNKTITEAMTDGTFDDETRVAMNTLESAVIGVALESSIPYAGKAFKKFLNKSTANSIDGHTAIITKRDPELAKKATDSEIPSSSIVTDIDVEDSLSTGGILPDEMPAKLREDHLAKRVSYSQKKRKKRLAKKLSKREQVVETAKDIEADEVVPERLYKGSDFRAKFDEGESLARELDDEISMIRSQVTNGNVPDIDVDYTRKLVEGLNQIGPKKKGRLNPKTAGDLHSDGSYRLFSQLAESAGYVKKTVTQEESLTQAFKRLWDSDTKSFEEVYTLTNGPASRETLKKEVLQAIDEAITAGVDDVLANPQLARELVSSIAELDKLDSSMSGYISQSARILNLQKVSPSRIQEKLLKMQSDVIQTKADRAKNIKTVQDVATFIDGDTLTKSDVKKLLNRVKTMRNKLDDGASLAEAINTRTFTDIWLTNTVGGMLSGVVTLTRSVLGGGLTNTLYKGILEGGIRNLYQGGNVGTVLHRTKSMAKVALSGLKMQSDMLDDVNKILRDVETDYTNLLTPEGQKLATGSKLTTADVIKADIDNTVEAYLAEGTLSGKLKAKALDNKVTPWVTLLSGWGIRKMKGIDDYIKRINIAGDVETEAMIAYSSDNVDKLFGGRLPFDEFRKKYTAQVAGLSEAKKILDKTGDIDAYEDYIKGLHPEALKVMEESIDNVNNRALQATLQESLDDSSVLKWTHDTINKAKTSDSSALKASSTSFFPFVKSALNGTRQTGELLPLISFTSKRHRDLAKKAFVSKDPVALKDYLAKFTAGGILFGSATALVHSTQVVGNKIPQHMQDHRGIKPRSIRIGDSFYSYDGLGPLGQYLSIIADYKNVLQDVGMSINPEKDSDLMLEMAMSTISAMGSETGLGGIKDLSTLTMGKDAKSALKVVGSKVQLLTTPVSGAQRMFGDLVESATGTEKRIAEKDTKDIANVLYASMLNGMGAYAPQEYVLRNASEMIGASDVELTNKVDLTGRPIESSLGKGLLGILGVRTTPATDSKVRRTMARYGIIGDPFSVNRRGEVEGVSLSATQEARLRKHTYLGPNGLEERVRRLMDSGHWSLMNVGQREDMLKSMKTEATERAKAILKISDDSIAPKVLKSLGDEYRRRQRVDFDDVLDSLQGK